MRNAKELARIFKTLSVDTRVRIVQLLKDRALCVGALSAMLGVTQGAVSQHLRILRDANLVIAEKRGYYVHYRINPKTLGRWSKKINGFLGQSRSGKTACPWRENGKERKDVRREKRVSKAKKAER